ncbi:hypothetical protein G4G28_20505 [Massilia sp. Dwa41.01b]|uniref:hypothetical protein n=1 Tax=unclassified Massilia TaxID=2609279 RepID=UPI001601D746|nr:MULTISPECIES: hypothetical protein [unclassified Massilia]QNA90287.1 hypothetical protein G4G28_20505 [Massilia sp. Dwa41.01b]QNB01188.1 hypothetical protein G4G31_24135 [Massilia sp. Se16.2.3]
MKTAYRHLVRVAALLTFTAASASVFAQSSEYRRGYDDGFAAGQRAAMGERGDRGGRNWGHLRVERADYGARGALCDARQAVRAEVDRNGGMVVVGNHLCGDPIRNVQKRLDIVYRCGDDAPVRLSGRENETLRLSCRR